MMLTRVKQTLKASMLGKRPDFPPFRNPTSSLELPIKLSAVPACLTVILDRNQEHNYQNMTFSEGKNGFDVKLVSAVTYKISQQKFTSTRKLSLLLCT